MYSPGLHALTEQCDEDVAPIAVLPILAYFPLEQVLSGQLEDVIGACIAEEQKRQMEELSNQSAE